MERWTNCFTVEEMTGHASGFSARVRLNPDHPVYAVHFPGQPVTPGVMLVKLVHELLEQHLNRRLRLLSITQCKFLNMLVPNRTPQMLVHVDVAETGGHIDCKARGEFDGVVFFKLDSVYSGY